MRTFISYLFLFFKHNWTKCGTRSDYVDVCKLTNTDSYQQNKISFRIKSLNWLSAACPAIIVIFLISKVVYDSQQHYHWTHVDIIAHCGHEEPRLTLKTGLVFKLHSLWIPAISWTENFNKLTEYKWLCLQWLRFSIWAGKTGFSTVWKGKLHQKLSPYTTPVIT